MSENYKIDSYNENFDFFDDNIPETDKLFFTLGDQLNRARVILKNRSREEIEYIIESLDWMLRESSQVEFSNSMERLKTEDSVFINRVKAFKLFSHDYDISEQDSLPNASWADYFATLSLVTILEALHPKNRDYVLINLDYPMEALEAVCLAEFHREIEEVASKAAKKKGSTGGKKRAQKYKVLKELLLNEYSSNDKYKNKTYRHSARLLIEHFSNDVNAVLSEDNARDTIQRWISELHKNG